MSSVQRSVSAPQSPTSITSTSVEAPSAPRKPAHMRSRLGGTTLDIPRGCWSGSASKTTPTCCEWLGD